MNPADQRKQPSSANPCGDSIPTPSITPLRKRSKSTGTLASSDDMSAGSSFQKNLSRKRSKSTGTLASSVVIHTQNGSQPAPQILATNNEGHEEILEAISATTTPQPSPQANKSSSSTSPKKREKKEHHSESPKKSPKKSPQKREKKEHHSESPKKSPFSQGSAVASEAFLPAPKWPVLCSDATVGEFPPISVPKDAPPPPLEAIEKDILPPPLEPIDDITPPSSSRSSSSSPRFYSLSKNSSYDSIQNSDASPSSEPQLNITPLGKQDAALQSAQEKADKIIEKILEISALSLYQDQYEEYKKNKIQKIRQQNEFILWKKMQDLHLDYQTKVQQLRQSLPERIYYKDLPGKAFEEDAKDADRDEIHLPKDPLKTSEAISAQKQDEDILRRTRFWNIIGALLGLGSTARLPATLTNFINNSGRESDEDFVGFSEAEIIFVAIACTFSLVAMDLLYPSLSLHYDTWSIKQKREKYLKTVTLTDKEYEKKKKEIGDNKKDFEAAQQEFHLFIGSKSKSREQVKHDITTLIKSDVLVRRLLRNELNVDIDGVLEDYAKMSSPETITHLLLRHATDRTAKVYKTRHPLNDRWMNDLEWLQIVKTPARAITIMLLIKRLTDVGDIPEHPYQLIPEDHYNVAILAIVLLALLIGYRQRQMEKEKEERMETYELAMQPMKQAEMYKLLELVFKTIQAKIDDPNKQMLRPPPQNSWLTDIVYFKLSLSIFFLGSLFRRIFSMLNLWEGERPFWMDDTALTIAALCWCIDVSFMSLSLHQEKWKLRQNDILRDNLQPYEANKIKLTGIISSTEYSALALKFKEGENQFNLDDLNDYKKLKGSENETKSYRQEHPYRYRCWYVVEKIGFLKFYLRSLSICLTLSSFAGDPLEVEDAALISIIGGFVGLVLGIVNSIRDERFYTEKYTNKYTTFEGGAAYKDPERHYQVSTACMIRYTLGNTGHKSAPVSSRDCASPISYQNSNTGPGNGFD